MAASSPRKRTPRPKAAPEREPSPNGEVIEAYADLRERARRSGLTLRRNENGPFTIPGFDPPIEAHWPAKLLDRERFDIASRNGMFLDMLRVLLDPDDFGRVLERFDEFDDSEELLIGLVMRIIDHVHGPGASDAPGGSTAS